MQRSEGHRSWYIVADTMRISFDRELARGVEAYEDVLGRWWFGQSSNAAHRRAYWRVANYIAASFQDSPGVIVDYACGAGNLLYRLATRFPHSRLIGLDGSSYLLSLARRRLGRLGESVLPRCFFVRTVLPKLDLEIRANLVVFTFPNMVPGSAKAPPRQVESCLAPEDCELARALAALGTAGAETRLSAYNDLLRGRLISLNLRSLLRRGGHCVRAEYAGARRDQITKAEIMRASFEEGSLEAGVDGRLRKPWFRVLASAYFRSGVMEDVRRQTKDTRDRGGGYQITVLRAV